MSEFFTTIAPSFGQIKSGFNDMQIAGGFDGQRVHPRCCFLAGAAFKLTHLVVPSNQQGMSRHCFRYSRE